MNGNRENGSRNGEKPVVSMRPGHGPGRGGPMGGRVNGEKPKDAKKTFGKLVVYIGKSKFMVLGLILIVIVSALLNLAGPSLQAVAIDTLTLDQNAGKLAVDLPTLLKVLALMGCVYLVSAGATALQGICAAKLSQKTVYTMRADLFAKLEYLPIRYIDTHKHGDIMSRMTNDVENISNTISQSLASLFSSVITLVGALVLMLCYSWQLTLVAMVSIPLTIISSNLLVKHMRKYFSEQSRRLGALNGHIEEMVTGYKTVMAYGKEGEAIERFEDMSGSYRRVSILASIWGSVMGPIMNLIGNFSYLLLVAVGGYMIASGAAVYGSLLTIGALQAVLGYSKQFTRPINEIANQYSSIMSASLRSLTASRRPITAKIRSESRML